MDWKKVVRWGAAMVVAGAVFMLVGGYAVLKSERFHRYVLGRLVASAESATGGRVEIENWKPHFSPLKVDVYGIVLHGQELAGASPLLQADRLTVGLNAGALLSRKLQLSELWLEHPVVNVVVNRSGQSNIPVPPPSQSKGTTTVWELAVQHSVLSRGEIYYNDKKTPLDADLRDLKSEIRFDPASTSYSGFLSYDNGRLQWANYSSLPHSLTAQFSANPKGLSLSALQVRTGSSQIALRGEIADYSNPKVDAAYEMRIQAEDFASFTPGVKSSGDVEINGRFRYANVPHQPLLRSIAVDGKVTSGSLQAATADGRLDIQNLKAAYDMADGDLDVREVVADAAGGHVMGNVSVHHLDSTPEGKFHGTLQHLSVQSARQASRWPQFRRMPVTGTVEAKLDGYWKKNISQIHLVGDIGARAMVWGDSGDNNEATPVDGDVHVSYDGEHNTLALHQSTVRIPSSSATLDGQLGGHSNLRIHAVSGDLQRLMDLVSSVRELSSESAGNPIAASGEAVLDAVVSGTMKEPRFSGQLTASNLEVEGSKWKTAKATFEAGPSEFKIQQGSLVSARQGNVSVNGQVGLQRWSFRPESPVQASASVRDMPVADLLHLANLQYPVTGTLSGDIVLQGSEVEPAGHGTVRIANGSAYNQPIQSFNVRFQGANGSVNGTANVASPAGGVDATLAYTPSTKAYQVDVHTAGIALQKLQAVQAKNLPMAGTLTISGSGKGTIDDPQLAMTLEIPSLQVRQTAVQEMKAQINVQDHRANLTLGSSVTQASVRAQASVELTGDYNAEASLDTSKIAIDPFLAVYVPSVPEGFHGETELHATLKGPLKDKSKLEAHLTVPTLNASYQGMQLSNDGPIRADYANSAVVLEPADIRGTDTSLNIGGRVPIPAAAMTVNAKGNINLALLGMFSSDLKSSGEINLNVQGSGTVQNPDVHGTIEIKNAALSSPDMPVGLSKVNGTINVTQDRLQIASLSGQMGGGEISAGGSIAFRPSLEFGVSLEGKSIRLLYPQGVRTVLNSNLTFTGNLNAASLTGRALVDSLNFTPDFDLATFATQFNGISIPSTGESFADRIKLAIALQSTQSLSARSSQVSLEGMANLQVGGTASDPVITGRVDLTSGELFFMSNRYELQRGIITFDSPNQTHPVLNVQATSTIEQYNLTLTVTGPIERLATNYSSDPALPTADVISLIYRGETEEQAAAAGTSTDSLLAGQAAGQFTSGLSKLAGISSLQIDPAIGGNSSDPSTRIALQQRVTKNFLFTFSTDVSQPEAEIVEGEYEINKRWSVSVTRDEVGGISVDGRYHTRF
jgi:translocation and assembly module TamB